MRSLVPVKNQSFQDEMRQCLQQLHVVILLKGMENAIRLLADRLVEIGIVDSISRETVRKTLKKRT
jgi:hypothetical protein